MDAHTQQNEIEFELDGKIIKARADETIWQVAKRTGLTLPHLCFKDDPGYRSDGNCRACMVEIEGERTLVASCNRKASQGMVVKTQTERAKNSRKMVMELLLTDQPSKEKAHDQSSHFWEMSELADISISRFPQTAQDHIPLTDSSHIAMNVNLDSCIQCNLCVRACRDVQHNDVIGLSHRGRESLITFDLQDPMGESTCVACGECVQACPTGALTASSIADTKTRESDKKVNSVCPYCGVGCQLTYHISDGKIRHVEGRNGYSNENRLCVKGRFGFDYITHPHRLTKPLIRREDAPEKDLNIDPSNPLTHFREASWEEAIAYSAEKIKALSHKFGGNTIAGFGSAKCSNEEAYLFQKLIRTGFNHNNVDHCTRLFHASSVAALMENIGSGAVSATFNEVKNADVVIAIGCNPTANHPVAATYFKEFVARGGKLITMDPRSHEMSARAWRHLQFKPGSDVALLNSIMHVIVKEELYDQNYIDQNTENFEALKQHLSDYSPEAMEKISGITPQTIVEVARAFAKAKAGMIFWGMGISQHTHGTDNSRCLISLALMCGHVGKNGAGLHPLRGQNNVQGASDAGLIPMVLPDYQPVGNEAIREKFESVWGYEINPNPGLTVVEIMNHVYDGNIKGMYILGENPAMSDPDLNHVRSAFEKLEFLVVQDLFITEAANYADVILPASAWPEKNGTATNTNRQVQMGRKAVDAPGDAKEDWQIIVELANALGLKWTYQHPKDVFEEMTKVMPSLDNITWDRLENESSIIYPSLSPTDSGQPIVFTDGFPREGSRAKFTPATYQASAEIPDSEYPLILTTGRQLEHWHTGSMTRRANVLDTIEPGPTAALHPTTLNKIGIKPGQEIRLVTRRGEITLTARVDEGLQKHMVFVPFAFVEAAANILTNAVLDPFGKIPEFKYCACRIEI